MTNFTDLLSALVSGDSSDLSMQTPNVSITYSDIANTFAKFEVGLSEEKRVIWESEESVEYNNYGSIAYISIRSAFSRIVRNIVYPTGWMIDGRPLPKFFAHEYYKEYHINLPEWVKSSFGGILGKLNRTINLDMRLSPVVDWQSGDFGDSGSCYWVGREDARPAILNAGGGSLRIWDADSGQGIGRAWYMTHNEGLILWNAYGPYDLMIIGSFLEKQFNCESSSVNLHNHGETHGIVWINGGDGIYLTSPDCSHHPSTIDLKIDIRTRVRCANCGALEYTYDMTTDNNDHPYCESCASSLVYCTRCGDAFWPTDDHTVYDSHTGDTLRYCSSSCKHSDGWYQCDYCGRYNRHDRDADSISFPYSNGDGIWGRTKHYCDADCAINDGYTLCSVCGDLIKRINTIDGIIYCDACYGRACTD